MVEGRFESLGRGIYRTFETDPKQVGEAQELLLKGLEAMETFLKAQLVQKQKDAQDCPPDIAATRQLVVEDIQDEIKWTREAIVWFNEGAMRKKHFDLAQYEADKAQKLNK